MRKNTLYMEATTILANICTTTKPCISSFDCILECGAYIYTQFFACCIFVEMCLHSLGSEALLHAPQQCSQVLVWWLYLAKSSKLTPSSPSAPAGFSSLSSSFGRLTSLLRSSLSSSQLHISMEGGRKFLYWMASDALVDFRLPPS